MGLNASVRVCSSENPSDLSIVKDMLSLRMLKAHGLLFIPKLSEGLNENAHSVPAKDGHVVSIQDHIPTALSAFQHQQNGQTMLSWGT